MKQQQSTSPEPDLREHLAAERTFLAYIRTGLALMGFGFVVARFSLFLDETIPGPPPQASAMSLWLGAGLVMLGVMVNVLSIFEYRHLIDRLNRAHSANLRPARLAEATSALVALCGAVMAVYLLWTNNNA